MTLHEQLRQIGFPCQEIAPAYVDFFTPMRLTQLRTIAGQILPHDFFPHAEQVLRFVAVDPTHLRCIIVGMDPYPSFTVDATGNIVPEATGRSFEVASVSDWGDKYRQASLRNILKAIYYQEYRKVPSMEDLRKALSDGTFPILPPHDWWDSLEQQGVLFLNASLTVEPGKPGTHTQLWDTFITDLMLYLADQAPTATWLLWGSVAQTRIPVSIQNRICSPHPRLPQFVTECPFAKIPEIRWLG